MDEEEASPLGWIACAREAMDFLREKLRWALMKRVCVPPCRVFAARYRKESTEFASPQGFPCSQRLKKFSAIDLVW